MLGGRPVSRLVREVGAPRNYLAAARIPLVTGEPLDFARRFFLGGGSYPYACSIRTPLGLFRPTLYSNHDVWTVSEIFCREDYRVSSDIEVAVDVGSNIGLSALYFLTRNAKVRSYLYEPDPRNTERLERNLAALAGRWTLEPAAVAPEGGEVDFGREATGRYGAIGAATGDVIRVRCVGINDVLRSVLARERRIDVLKLDIEGFEGATVAAIRPELMDRIETIYFESERPLRLHEDRFAYSFSHETVRLRRRAASARLAAPATDERPLA